MSKQFNASFNDLRVVICIKHIMSLVKSMSCGACALGGTPVQQLLSMTLGLTPLNSRLFSLRALSVTSPARDTCSWP